MTVKKGLYPILLLLFPMGGEWGAVSLTKSDYGWYVSYRVLDPENPKLKLQRSRAELGRIHDLKDREKHAKRVIFEKSVYMKNNE